MYGLRVPGSLNVSLKEVLGVGIYSLEQNLLYNVLMYDTVEHPRSKANGSFGYTHYIETEYDLNSKISYQPSSSEYNKDDAYGLEAISISSTNSVNEVFSLPSASNILVNAGLINAQDPDAQSLGNFPVVLNISCGANGVMTSSISITGQDVYSNGIENYEKSQKVYWPVKESAPTIDVDSADILRTKITSSELANSYSTQLQAINNQYNNKQMINSWSISISEITSSTNNVLSQHARYLEKNGNPNVFDDGEKMVAATPFSYEIIVDDYLDNSTTIVSAANVYGVIKHKSQNP